MFSLYGISCLDHKFYLFIVGLCRRLPGGGYYPLPLPARSFASEPRRSRARPAISLSFEAEFFQNFFVVFPDFRARLAGTLVTPCT